MEIKDESEKSRALRFGALYWTIRREYFDIMHDASQTFDKVIMTLSTISLGFTFGLASYKGSVNLPCFAVLAGLLFILSIASSLYSLWLRQDYGVKAIGNWNDEYKVDMEYQDYNKKSKQFEDPIIRRMEITQALSGIFFLTALFLLLIFVSGSIISH